MDRIVLKVGSSSLTDEQGKLQFLKILQIVQQVTELKNQGQQVLLVSSGAIAAGVELLGSIRSSMTVPEKQAAAAVGQAKLIEKYTNLFQEFGYLGAQILLSREDMDDPVRSDHLRNTIEALLAKGVIPIFNENDSVAVEEIRFGDNDQLAAKVAILVEAKTLLLLTDIDGLYSDNPKTNPGAVRVPVVHQITEELLLTAGAAGSSVGTGGMRSKVLAAKIATENGVCVHILPSGVQNSVVRSLAGEDLGTQFLANSMTNPIFP